MRGLSDIFKALADETRLAMLALLLKKGELCVCDFEEVLEISQSKASRHLRYLLNAGFLWDRRGGIWVYYRIAEDLSDDHKVILKALHKILDRERVEELHERLERWLKKKGCESPIRRGKKNENRELPK